MEPSESDVRAILATCPNVAVLGISDEPHKPAHYVPAYLHDHGYNIFGVNPKNAGTSMFGRIVASTCADLHQPGSIDVIDVFRRAELLAGHVDDVLAAAPRVVWLQQGIRNDDVAAQWRAAGIIVVQDRCMLADHRRMRIGRPTSPRLR